MELALGLDSRDIPMARYANPDEQLARLEEEEKKYDKIIKTSRVAKYGSLLGMGGAVFFCDISSMADLLGTIAVSLGAATIAAFEEDHAKQKAMVLKVRKEEIKRAANPQGYVEQAIEDTKIEMNKQHATFEHAIHSWQDDHERTTRQSYLLAEWYKKKVDLYTKAYEQAKKDGKMEELSHLVCKCEAYQKMEPLRRKEPGLKEPTHLMAYTLGGMLPGVAIGNGSTTEKIMGCIVLAEMGVIFAKNVARFVKNRKINKDEEKSHEAIENFVNKNEKVR